MAALFQWVASALSEAGEVTSESGRVAALLLSVGGSAILMTVGAVGPWLTVFGVDSSGLEGDGTIVLAAAAVAIGSLALGARALAVRRWPVVVTGIAGAVSLAITSYDAFELYQAASSGVRSVLGFQLVQLGWGFVVAWAASAALCASSMWALRRTSLKP